MTNKIFCFQKEEWEKNKFILALITDNKIKLK